MTIRRILLTAAALIPLAAEAEPAEIGQFEDETFASGSFAKESPDFLFAEIENGHHFSFSMAQGDFLFERYAENLRPLTDRRFPHARTYRKSLTDCFTSMFDFMMPLVEYNIGHQRVRTPGRVEWLIYHGALTNYHEDEEDRSTRKYRFKDVKRIAIELGNTHVNRPFMQLDISNLRVSLNNLSAAERHMSGIQKHYFRRRLVKLMRQYL
jgi:uncharacterized protein YozE (UPF0346 family)